MKKKNIVTSALAAAILTAALIGCGEDDDEPISLSSEKLTVTAGINTRAADNAWHKGDAIGVYQLKAGTTTIEQKNAKYVNKKEDGAEAAFDAEKPIELYDTNVDVIAYYPYTAGVLPDLGTIETNVKDQTSLPAIDLMTSDKATGLNKEKTNAELAFTHRLTKLVIILKADKALGDIDLNTAKVTVKGTPGTAAYSLLTQAFTAIGTPADIEMKSLTAILVPIKAGSGVSFVIEAGGTTFTVPLPEAIAFVSGEEVTLTITLEGTEEGPGNASVSAMINPWTGGPTAGLTALDINIPQGGGEVIADGLTEFTLWKSSNATDVRTYTLTAGNWTASPAPFYTADAVQGTTFKAEATLGTADPVTGLLDVLDGNAIVSPDGHLPLTFSHVHAQLAFSLALAAGHTANLNGATIDLGNYKGFAADGTTYLIDAADWTGQGITITLADGTKYNGASAFETYAGSRTIAAITLDKGTQIPASVTATVTPWANTPDAPLTALNIDIPPGNMSIDGALTEFVLWKGNDLADKRTYTLSGTDWIASPAPFYVANVAAGDVFHATATLLTDPVTNMADELEATGTSTEAGKLTLAFTHVHAQLEFKLAVAPGHTASLDGAVIDFDTYSALRAEGTNYLMPVANWTGKALTVTLANGSQYNGTASFSTEKGKKTVVTITLDRSNQIPASITVTAVVGWGTPVQATDNVYIDLAGMANDIKGLGAGTLVLASGSNTATYTFDGTTLTSAAPLKWDVLSNAIAHNFTLTYTSTEKRPESDVIIFVANNVAWGMPIVFNSGTRQKVKFSINLIAGNGYTDAELSGSTISLVGFSTNPHTYTYPDYAILSPVAALDASHFATLSVGGQSYTLNLSGKFTAFEAGKEYVLNATVNKSGLTGISISSITDWGIPINGSGNFQY